MGSFKRTKPMLSVRVSIRTPKRYNKSAAFKKTILNDPTRPQMKSIKAVRVEVIANAVATPTLSATRVGGVAPGVGPAYSQVGRLSSYKVVHLVDHQLEIPLFILGGAFGNTQEDVWPHAADARINSSSLREVRVYSIELVEQTSAPTRHNKHLQHACIYLLYLSAINYEIQKHFRSRILKVSPSLPLDVINQSSLQ